jgi:hypothetical protein
MEFLTSRPTGHHSVKNYITKNLQLKSNQRRGRLVMAEATKSSMVYVYDKEGNAYICNMEDLRDASTVSDQEKADCTDLDRGGFSRNE